MKYCEDCGTGMWDDKCPNCHEELCIVDQYLDQGMKLPDEDTEFMKRAAAQEKELSKKCS